MTATVCSKCADSDPSSVTIDHRSSRRTTSGPWAVIIGSIASVMPSASRGPRPGSPKFDLRLLVHVAPHAVADEAADDREPRLLDHELHRRRDVADAVAHAGLLDPGHERGLARLEEALRLVRDSPTAYDQAESATKPPSVTPTSIATTSPVGERVEAGDPVHDHVVAGDAERRRVAAVALEGRDAASERMYSSAIRSSSPVVTPGRTCSRISSCVRRRPRRPRPSARARVRSCG